MWGFFPHGKSSRFTTGDSSGTLIGGKQRCAFAVEISSSPTYRIVSYNSSGWESRGFFPHGKSSRLTTGGNGGHVDHGKTKSRSRTIRRASCFFDENHNAKSFGYWGVCPPVKTGGFPAVGGRRGLGKKSSPVGRGALSRGSGAGVGVNATPFDCLGGSAVA